MRPKGSRRRSWSGSSGAPGDVRLGCGEPEVCGQRARGPSAVTDRVLLGVGELGHGPIVRRLEVARDERRVVAEAALATGVAGELSLATALEEVIVPVGIDVGERADVRNRAILFLPQLPDQQC